MIRHLTMFCVLCAFCTSQAFADEFYEFPDEFESVEVFYPDDIGGEYWPASNLIQGPGYGFEEEEPYDKIGSGAEGNWVTTADCGYPADYIDCVGMPVIQLDLGADVLLDEISTWGYEDGNTNGTREFELLFATSAEGTGGFGSGITYNPSFLVEEFDEFLAIERRSFEFDQQVTARYVQMTVTDNYFDDPGDGSGENGWGPGGDRVGLGEIAFRIPDGPVGKVGDYNSNGFLDEGDLDLQASVGIVNQDLSYDANKDGVVNTADRVVWVNDFKNTWMGDANLDGLFNSSDLVTVFSFAKYETGEAATWKQGDWDGDQTFDSGDLVTAFGNAGYNAGERPGGPNPAVAIPEPSSLVLLLIGLIALTRNRK
ncbi:MAG: PEP-CTERM sorting domain-containing protein [Pirellulaceae bacterium]|nr:PEP-CTERM sorting domain-containing protein [Pirellulaceae bacterium]